MGTSLEDLEVLQVAEAIADQLWEVVGRWDAFARNTVGEQGVRAGDSIGANIAESFGRYHYGEKINYLYYARGSLFETKYWINRARSRKLLTEEEARTFADRLNALAQRINAFAAALKKQRVRPKKNDPDQLQERREAYSTTISPELLPIFSPEDLAWLSHPGA